jgi:UPF0271 protein
VREIDLNADVGEGDPEADEALLLLVTSANVACGLHAGDAYSMRATVGLAMRHSVAVGAHPGYDDREGFGRRPMQLSAADIKDLVLYQLGALDAIARSEGAIVRHVKPHGALYNQAETDDALAAAIIGADRRYRADGTLMPRSEPGAVLTDPEEVARQVRSLVTRGEVVAGDGSHLPVAFETLCLHGDTPGSAALGARIRRELHALGVSVSAPGSPAAGTIQP